MGRKTKQNNITSPELLEKVNPKNKQLKRDYIAYLRSVDRSETTIFGYENDIDIFFVWLLQNDDNKFFIDLHKRDIVSFQNYMLYENGNSPARVRRLKATLSSMSNYVENILDDEYPNYKNIIHGIESPTNVPVRKKTVLTDEQCQELLDALVSKKQYEKACCAALAMFGGRRKAELVRFKVSYFDDSNIIYDTLYKTPETIKTKGRGSKGKAITCYTVANQFKPYFDLWMNERNEKGIESEWLFPSSNNPKEHLGASTLNSWAKTFSNILGVDFYWHSARHRLCTALAKSGLPDQVIQELFGWSSIDMVSIYKDVDVSDELGKYFQGGEIVSHESKSIKDIQ